MTKTTPLRGNGWRVIERPRVPHEALEAFARDVWRLAFHAIPWPSGWQVRWGVLTDAYATCAYEARLILIDEERMLPGQPRDVVEALIHEMAHLHHPAEWTQTGIHGPRFQATCDQATAFVLSELDPERGIHEPTTDGDGPDVVCEPEWEYR